MQRAREPRSQYSTIAVEQWMSLIHGASYHSEFLQNQEVAVWLHIYTQLAHDLAAFGGLLVVDTVHRVEGLSIISRESRLCFEL